MVQRERTREAQREIFSDTQDLTTDDEARLPGLHKTTEDKIPKKKVVITTALHVSHGQGFHPFPLILSIIRLYCSAAKTTVLARDKLTLFFRYGLFLLLFASHSCISFFELDRNKNRLKIETLSLAYPN